MTSDLQQREHRRQREQLELDSRRSPLERNRLGQFATPINLAIDIVSEVARYFKEEQVRFLDPAFGSGAFLSALYRVFDTGRVVSATGVEIDPGFALLARQLWSEEPYSANVVNADFTKLSPPKIQPNLIVCNPPYIRHHHLVPETKLELGKQVQQVVGLSLSGLAGMYCYFLLLSHQWLAPGGVAAWLVPTEFMDVNYGQVIRTYLTEKVTLRRLHCFETSDVQFADALVSSAVVILENRQPVIGNKAILTVGGSLLSPKRRIEVPLAELGKEDKWTKLPRKQKMVKSDLELTFGNLFSTRRGIATGANNFFIMTREQARERELPAQFLKAILPSPRYLTSTVIEADVDGFPLLSTQLVLLDCALPEVQVKAQYPSLWEYLQEGRKQGIDQRYLSSKREPWYRQEEVELSPFLCTYMGRSSVKTTAFRFIWNQSEAIAPNVYLLVYPRAELAAFVGDSVERQALVFDLLKQIATEDIVRAGRTYGGGLHKIEPRELYRVSLAHIARARELAAVTMLF